LYRLSLGWYVSPLGVRTPGLVSSLVGLVSRDQAARDPLRGGLFENLIVSEVARWYSNRGLDPDLCFYRDSHGNEVDLICRNGRRLVPIEIKSAATFTPSFVKGIERFRALLDDEPHPGFVLFNGDRAFNYRGVEAFNPFIHLDRVEALKAQLFGE